jgi:hypothetical protein
MPSKPKKKTKAGARKRSKAPSETDELEQKLVEVREHRDLLIRALHGFAANAAPPRNLVRTISKPDLEAILQWLVEKIGELTTTRPILGASTLAALKVPLPTLTKAVNSKWFPNGGGFPSIAGSTTVGNLAYAIWEHV